VKDRLELLIFDVANDASVASAALSLKTKGVYLIAIVNNAGIGNQKDNGVITLIQTNFYGPKRVTDSFFESIDPTFGRIVNVSSGAACMWLRNCTPQ